MTKPQDSNEQDSDRKDSAPPWSDSPVYYLASTSFEAVDPFLEYVRREQESNTKALRRLTEEAEQIEKDLLLGDIDVRLIFPEVSETEALPLLFVCLSLLALSVMAAALAMKGSINATLVGKSSSVVDYTAEASWLLFMYGILAFLIYLGINLSGTPVENVRTLVISYLVFAAVGWVAGTLPARKMTNSSPKIEAPSEKSKG